MTDDFDILNETKESMTEVAKCPSCSAVMVFSPRKRMLVCGYCGQTKEIDLSNHAKEQPFYILESSDSTEWGRDAHVFSCNNCGAKTILSKGEVAKSCPFCGTTNVIESEEIPGLKPNGIVPFSIEKDEASSNILLWAKKKFFAPKAFKESATPEELSGVYSPTFSFDAKTYSTYDGRLGEYYYETQRTSDGKTKQVRKTRYFTIRGTIDCPFDDILVRATQSITQKDLTKLGDFNSNESYNYANEFLYGYSAETSSRTGLDCFRDAESIMNELIKKKILSNYSYDVVDYLNINVSYTDRSFKYLLLPLYIGHCNYKSKLYNVFVNGYNGKVTGKTPISFVKVLLVSLIIIAIIALFGILLYYYEV
ncbi:hypothetical protein J6Y73_04150 [bacterium]|nr:hypothetical protein [bacterium]